MNGPTIREAEVDSQRIARTFGILFLLTWVTGIRWRDPTDRLQESSVVPPINPLERRDL